MAARTTAHKALKEIQAAGYRYAGTKLPAHVYAQLSLAVICTVCATPRTISLNRLRNGTVCLHRSHVSPAGAAQIARKAGFRPREPYDQRSRSWTLDCLTCGRTHRIMWPTLLSGTAKCPCQERAAELRAAGYEPQAPYPGTARQPWPSTCTTCKAARTPSLTTIRSGARCGHNGTPHATAAAERRGVRAELRAAQGARPQ
ncbi:hypothetical protein ACIPSE_44765 [Streptomyces sp. NPDC090106]|uniref:hypothetical protein n=1 Tax=Streptomyces sp. NPDC090106 TaxID=3365946 RepID=UPI003825857A